LLDLAAAILLSAALARRHRLATAGAFGGVLPDLVMVTAIGVLTQLITTGLLLARLRQS
jgi:hypothetical protein